MPTDKANEIHMESTKNLSQINAIKKTKVSFKSICNINKSFFILCLLTI